MPHGGFSGRLTSPKLGLAVDMGHPFLNHAVDGFIKIGAVSSQIILFHVDLQFYIHLKLFIIFIMHTDIRMHSIIYELKKVKTT